MYRKQVRRRRAVLALLVVGSFVLLTITYGQGSNGLQRGVSADLQPGPGGRRPGAEARPRPRQLVRRDLRRARPQQPPARPNCEAAREQAVGANAALAENAQLRKLLELDRSGAIPSGYEPVTGRVIARSPTVWFSDVTIDVGSGDGVEVDDPVVNGDGLVGTVSAVTGGSAQVTLIADHSSAVSAKVVPAGSQGVIRPDVGDPDDLDPRLHRLDQARPQGPGRW